MGVRLKSSHRRLVEKAASFDKKDLSKWARHVLVTSAVRQIRAASGVGAT
jgi:uncharacterized protein (DUF1778 family)